MGLQDLVSKGDKPAGKENEREHLCPSLPSLTIPSAPKALGTQKFWNLNPFPVP